MKKQNEPKLSDITFGIPMFTSYDNSQDSPIKNELMFEFKDEVIDLGRLIGYLNLLPTKERDAKLKKFAKIFNIIGF